MDNFFGIDNNFLRVYLEKFFFVEKFMRNNIRKPIDNEKLESHKFAWSLFNNTCKCILISHVLFFGHQFSKGKRFYMVYLRTSLKASLFGFLYSVYFNDQKLEIFIAKKRISLQNYLFCYFI